MNYCPKRENFWSLFQSVTLLSVPSSEETFGGRMCPTHCGGGKSKHFVRVANATTDFANVLCLMNQHYKKLHDSIYALNAVEIATPLVLRIPQCHKQDR